MYEPSKIGVTKLKTNDHSLSGELFREREDFIVEEIELDGNILNTKREEDASTAPPGKKDFLYFTLVKNSLSTHEALKFLSKDNNINIKRIGYLGNKDRNAVTAQRISIFKLDKDRMKKEYPKMFLKDFGYSESPCKIGELYGNRFKIRIRDFNGSEKELGDFIAESSTGLPNFYGPQHFGASALNIVLSKAIIKGDFKAAIISFLTEERDESVTAKEKRLLIRETFLPYLSDGASLDKTIAFETINGLPGFFYLERNVLRALVSNSKDYVGAFRLIPKYLRLLILQSFQAYLFNRTLSEALKSGNIPKSLPTIGYDLILEDKPKDIAESIRNVLSQEGISSLEDLNVPQMPEAGLKTFERDSLFYPENLSYVFSGKDLLLSFDLKKGIYATILLLEMLRRFA